MRTTFPKAIEKRNIQVVSLGSMALSCLFRTRKWQVIANFRRSFYCRDNRDNIICIGQAAIGKGPFTLLCSVDNGWPGNILSNTRQIRVRKKQLLLEGTGLIFDMHGASVWRKSLFTISGSDDHLQSDIRWVVGKVAGDAPSESLGMVVSNFFPVNVHNIRSRPSTLTDSLHKRFIEVISEVRRHPLLLPTGQLNTSFAEGLRPLMGLGPGLTPSGDDFLAGIVMGLFKMGKQDEAARLARHFYRAARGKVTIISLAFYRALAEGLVAEPFHQFLEAIGRGDYRELETLLRRVSLFGGTSGWDTIAGIVFGISLALPDMNEFRGCATEAVC